MYKPVIYYVALSADLVEAFLLITVVMILSLLSVFSLLIDRESYMSLRPGALQDELVQSMHHSVQSLEAGTHNLGHRMYHIQWHAFTMYLYILQ